MRAAGAVALPDSTYPGVRQLATPPSQWGRMCGKTKSARGGGVSGRERGKPVEREREREREME